MAIVKITDHVIWGVQGSIDKLHQGKILAAAQLPQLNWANRVYDAMFSDDIKKKMNELPSEYFQYVKSFSVRGNVTLTETLALELPKSMVFPHKLSVRVNGAEMGYQNQLRINEQDPRWKDLIIEFKAYHTRVRDAKAERDDAKRRAIEYLKSFPSVNKAVKSWPALLELLDENTKRRYNEEVPKKQERQAPTVNVDDITTAVAIERITRK